MPKRAEIQECFDGHDVDLLFLDPERYDDAIVGLVAAFGQHGPCVCYDLNKVIDILMKEDGMDLDAAFEFWEFNMVGAWVGPQSPVYLTLPCE